MTINFNFWTPTRVFDFSDSGSLQGNYRNKINETLLKIAEWADDFFYLGSDGISVVRSPKEGCTADLYVLKGRAKTSGLHNQIVIEKNLSEGSENTEEVVNEKKFEKKPLYILILKTAIIAMFFPAFLIVKACYKYLYIKSFFEQYNATPVSLDELIEAFPHDPDLITLKLSNQFDQFKKGTQQQPENYYTDLLLLIDKIKENMQLNPHQEHANLLFKKCLNMGLVSTVPWLKENDSEGKFLINDEQWFDFYGFVQKESEALKLPSDINLTFIEISKKIKTSEDKKNFRMIFEFGFFGAVLDLTPMKYFIATISVLKQENCVWKGHLEEDQCLEIINWLLDKEDIKQIPKNSQTPLAFFQEKVLKNTPQPYKQNILDLEKRFTQMDAGFTQEFNDRRLLANIFGIGGNTKIQNIFADMSGFPFETGILRDGELSPFKHNLNQIIYAELKLILGDSAQKSIYKDKLLQLQVLIDKKESPDFSSQLCVNATDLVDQPHAWSQVFYKGFLLIGNQGYGCQDYPGIVAFKVDKDKFKSSNSTKFKLESDKLGSLFGMSMAFLNQEYFEGLNASALGYLPRPSQRGSNCPWKAIKLNILSLLFIICSGEDLGKGESFKTLQKRHSSECLSIMREIVDQLKIRLLEKYLKKHSDLNCNQKIDNTLIKNLAEKAAYKKWTHVQRVLQDRKL
ncbi:MAG: hypothetical protein H0W88_12050 [Parachlamydiaceae bacterium]|nr:hypothetical protein [Parachlamydiaceae bacterium]